MFEGVDGLLPLSFRIICGRSRAVSVTVSFFCAAIAPRAVASATFTFSSSFVAWSETMMCQLCTPDCRCSGASTAGGVVGRRFPAGDCLG